MAAVVHPFMPRAEREGMISMPQAVAVEMSGPGPLEAGGIKVSPMPDGGVEIDFDPGIEEPGAAPGAAQEHYANIAEHLSGAQLARVGQDVVEMVEADVDARKPWFERFAKGLELIGVKEDHGVSLPFHGASKAVHPLIAEAIVQFQARALKELFPPAGPAKAIVLGDKTTEKEAQAERVKNYLNYQLTVEDDAYYPESDQLLWLVAFCGNVFRKVYNDPLTGRDVARIIRAEELIVPYAATTLKSSPRFTHLIPYSQNEMKRLQRSKFFLDTPLAPPSAAPSDNISEPAKEAKDEAEGKTDPMIREEDLEFSVLEMNVYYDIPGFEDLDEGGKPSGIALPWIITVERENSMVLAIRRGWREGDRERERRMQIAHYPFIRGDGFYAYGLIHLAGGLGDAATGSLRVILDNAAFSALQGGFKTKTAKLPSQMSMEPGKWADVDMTAEELKNSFFTPPFHPVPEAMFRVLGLLTEMGQRFVSTTEATVGDASNTGPVGTTLALIEQGSKIHSGIHSRLHHSLGLELKMLAELDGEHLPPEGYPYDVPGASREIFAQDFDERIDVLPVSDPNIFSQTQRIALAQSQLQLADSAPDLYDRRVAHRRMLEAMQVSDIDEILIKRGEVQRCDPVTENALAIVGRPIKVFMDQAHDAHVAVHLGQLQLLSAQGSPSAGMFSQMILPHVAEHEAVGMRLKLMQQIGIPLPPLNLDAEKNESVAIELPPEMENMVAIRAAEVMQQIMAQMQAQQSQQPPQQQPGSSPEQEAADLQAEQARKDAEFQGEERRKDAQAQIIERRKDMVLDAEERRKDMQAAAAVEREDAKTGLDPSVVRDASRYLKERGLDRLITARRLAVVSRELGRSFDEVIRMLMRMQSGAQGMGPAPLSMPVIPR